MNIFDPHVITAIGTAVGLAIVGFPFLAYLDKLKTNSMKSDFKKEVMDDIDKRRDADASNLRKMIEDVIGMHLLRMSTEMRELFDAKHDNTLEKFENLNRSTGERFARMEGDIERAKKDIDGIAGQCRDCRNRGIIQ